MIRQALGIALALYALTVPQPFTLLCVAGLLYVWGRPREDVPMNVRVKIERTDP